MELDLRIPSSLPMDGDPVRMTQVASNLLVNAAKYGHDRGHVWVELERDDSVARLRISDDGPGIDDALLPVLFEPFTQSERRRDQGPGGLGLGLSIVRQLVALHEGTIAALPRDGGGTVMDVRLPIVHRQR